MLRSYFEVYPDVNAESRHRAEHIGYATKLLLISSTFDSNLLQRLRAIDLAITQDRIRYYFNVDGVIVGFVVWGFLCERTEERIIKTGVVDLHPSEFNEGNALWILDLFVPFGHIAYVLKDLRDNLFKSYTALRFFRVKQNCVIVKELNRTSNRMSFFKNSQRPTRLGGLSMTMLPSWHEPPRV
jgi:hemolysin-activating ACP:hemolysin acyltransferase